MREWKNVLLDPSDSIRHAIEIIDASAMQIALVVENDYRLLGTVTDGDIRRGILKGLALDETVARVMNSDPCVANQKDSRESILAMMKQKVIRHIPIVDDNYRVVNVEILDDLIKARRNDNPVVIMAGGLGSRLSPLTDDCPKPLLRVGAKPILETILENFIEHGFWRFYLAVNYKAEMVKDYFGDGSRWGVEINYVHEEKRMGTAGALGLLPETPPQAIIVMNGDLLTKVNFQHLLDFHLEHKAWGTMCVREYDFQVPYGVARVKKHRLVAIEEKPTHRFFVSAGIYVLEPSALDLIPGDTFFDMPSLFEKLIDQEHETVVFPVREYWLDIGHMDDFERANGEYSMHFED